jgi:hypothetical protein
MANVSRVNGLRPVKHLDGSPWNGQLNRYVVLASDTTAIFQGDIVTLAATTDALGTQGVTKVNTATGVITAGPVVGVACGFSINPLNLNSPQYRAASTLSFVLVADAPDTVFEVQSAVAPTPTDLNSNATFSDAGGSTVTGQSGITVSAYTTSATAIGKVLGAAQKVDNDITSTNYKILVSLNNHQYGGGTGTLGV